MQAVSNIRAIVREQIEKGSAAAAAPFALESAGKGKKFSVIAANDPRAKSAAQSAELRSLIVDHFDAVSRDVKDAKIRLTLQAKGRTLANRLLSDARVANKPALSVSDLDWVLGHVESAGKNAGTIDKAIEAMDAPARAAEMKARAQAIAPPHAVVISLDEPDGVANLLKAVTERERSARTSVQSIARMAIPLFNALMHEEDLKKDCVSAFPPTPSRQISSDDILQFLATLPHEHQPTRLVVHIMQDSFFSTLRDEESEDVRDAVIDCVNSMKLQFAEFSAAANSSLGVNLLIPLLLLNLHPMHLQKLIVTHTQCDELVRDTFLMLGQVQCMATGDMSGLATKPSQQAAAMNINALGALAKKFLDTERGLSIAQRFAVSLTILRHNADRLESFVRSKHAGNAALEGEDISTVLETYVPAQYSSAPQIDLKAMGGSPLALQYFPQEVIEQPVTLAQAAPQKSEAKAERRDRAASVVMHVPATKAALPGEPTVEELAQVFAQAQPQRPAAQPGARQPQPAKHHHNAQFGGVVPRERVAERTDAREMIRLGLFGLKKWGMNVKDALRRLSDARAEQSGSQQLVKPPSLKNPPVNRRS